MTGKYSTNPASPPITLHSNSRDIILQAHHPPRLKFACHHLQPNPTTFNKHSPNSVTLHPSPPPHTQPLQSLPRKVIPLPRSCSIPTHSNTPTPRHAHPPFVHEAHGKLRATVPQLRRLSVQPNSRRLVPLNTFAVVVPVTQINSIRIHGVNIGGSSRTALPS